LSDEIVVEKKKKRKRTQ